MKYYILCIIFGIILFIYMNNIDTFSISNQKLVAPTYQPPAGAGAAGAGASWARKFYLMSNDKCRLGLLMTDDRVPDDSDRDPDDRRRVLFTEAISKVRFKNNSYTQYGEYTNSSVELVGPYGVISAAGGAQQYNPRHKYNTNNFDNFRDLNNYLHSQPSNLITKDTMLEKLRNGTVLPVNSFIFYIYRVQIEDGTYRYYIRLAQDGIYRGEYVVWISAEITHFEKIYLLYDWLYFVVYNRINAHTLSLLPNYHKNVLLDGIFLFNFMGDDQSMNLIELLYDFDTYTTLLGLEVMQPLQPYKIDSHSSDTYRDSDDSPNKRLYCLDKDTELPGYTVMCNPPSVWSITAHAELLYTSDTTSLTFFNLPDNVTIVSYFNPMHRNFCVKLFPDRNCGSIRMCDEIMDDTRYFSREYLKTHNGKMYGKYRGRYIDHEILVNVQGDGANCMKKCDVPINPDKVSRMTDLSKGVTPPWIGNTTLSKLVEDIIQQDLIIEGSSKPIEIHVFSCNYVPNNIPLKRTVFNWFRDHRISPRQDGDKYPYLDVIEDSSGTPHPNWGPDDHRRFLDTVNQTCGCKYETNDPRVDVSDCDYSDFEANTLVYYEDGGLCGEVYPYEHCDNTDQVNCHLACNPGTAPTEASVLQGTCSNTGSNNHGDIHHQFKDAGNNPVNITCIPERIPVSRCAAATRA